MRGPSPTLAPQGTRLGVTVGKGREKTKSRGGGRGWGRGGVIKGRGWGKREGFGGS